MSKPVFIRAASRGITVDTLLRNDHWSQGPPFLKQPKKTWPQRPADIGEISDSDPEVRKTVEVFPNTSNDQSNHSNAAMEKFSSWTHLKKVIAWVLHYKQNLKKQSQRRKAKEVISYQSDVSNITPLSVTEVNEAEGEIVKFIQKQIFKGELLALSQINPTKKSSSIYKLSPVLENGLKRVGGCLHQAPIESDAKHPVILPRKHHIVKLIINYYHRTSGHSGVEYMLSLIREKFWIVGA